MNSMRPPGDVFVSRLSIHWTKNCASAALARMGAPLTITNTAAVCTWWPSLPILRAAIHPLFGKLTVALKVTGVPDVTDAVRVATTTPLLTISMVPEKFCVAVHCTVTGRLPAAVNEISSPGVEVPFTLRSRNSLCPFLETTVRPAFIPLIQLRYVIWPFATWT